MDHKEKKSKKTSKGEGPARGWGKKERGSSTEKTRAPTTKRVQTEKTNLWGKVGRGKKRNKKQASKRQSGKMGQGHK